MKKLKIWIPFVLLMTILGLTIAVLLRQADKTIDASERDKQNHEKLTTTATTFSTVEWVGDTQVDEENKAAEAVKVEDTWNEETVYTEGQTVIYQGKVFKAKWWNTNEMPSADDEWGAWSYIEEVSKETNHKKPLGEKDKMPEKTPIKPETIKNFKVVAYYPSWKPDQVDCLQYDKLTHINYAFAIPNEDATLKPLENEAVAKRIIKEGHAQGVKVLLAVGGWEYQGTPLETTFVQATSSPEKVKKLGDAILEMVNAYGFDGVDMDWEHPRTDGDSKNQYAALVKYLSEALHKEEKLLSAAVLAGVSADGNVLWDAAGHLDEALAAVDYINVMAYDGGDGERHSSYEFAVDSAHYWIEQRNLPREKVILGVPFYGRPRWMTYNEILQIDPKAYEKDEVEGIYYNGIPTIEKKTEWAIENAGGIMIWEIAGDDKEHSLLTAIYNKIIHAIP